MIYRKKRKARKKQKGFSHGKAQKGAKRREEKKGQRLSFTWLNRGTSGLVSGFLGKDVWLDGDCTHIGEEGQRGAVFEEGWEVE